MPASRMYSTVLLSLLTKSVPSAGGVAGKRVLVRMLCPYQISLLSGKRFSMSEIVATRSSTRSVEWVAGFVLSGLLLVMVLWYRQLVEYGKRFLVVLVRGFPVRHAVY